MEWAYFTRSKFPDKPGWYAAMYCWESEQGIAAAAVRYDGYEWRESYSWGHYHDDVPRGLPCGLPIFAWSSRPFPTAEAAWAWVEANDPEG